MNKTIVLILVFAGLFFPVHAFAGTSQDALRDSIESLEGDLRKAQAAQGPLCDPETLAKAQTCLTLVREEYLEGDYWEAEDLLKKCRDESKGLWGQILACGKDRDVDWVPDQKDQCPEVPETYNGYKDLDGCPDIMPERALLTDERIQLIEPFRFTRIYNRLLPETKPLLLAVAQILAENPDLRVQIQVHLDNTLPEEPALIASRIRAEKVKTALEILGVQSDRLEAVGKGSLEPIASNRTAFGREINERVEFVIVGDGTALATTPVPQQAPDQQSPQENTTPEAS